MSIVAHSYPFVVGVDTHAKNHVYAILNALTGELLQTREFPTTSAGINRAIAWAARLTGADLAVLWVIEGAASYGALLAGAVGAAGYPVVEAARMDAKSHHGVGKSYAINARRIAAAVLALEEQHDRPEQDVVRCPDIEYAEKRRADGTTKKEIRRCIKRYLARRVYRTLNAANPTPCGV